MRVAHVRSHEDDRLLAELPARARKETLPEVLACVERLKEAAVYLFASDGAKGCVNIVVEWARARTILAPPSFTAVGDDRRLK